MEYALKDDIDLLLREARPAIATADQAGDSQVFTALGFKYGPTAHRVYLALDKPKRANEGDHSKETRRVLLEPMTVINRAHSLPGSGAVSLDDPEFWIHADMVKTFCDYLDRVYSKEVEYASA